MSGLILVAALYLMLIGLFLASVAYAQSNSSPTIRTSKGLNQTFIESKFKNLTVPDLLGALLEHYIQLRDLPYYLHSHPALEKAVLKALNESIAEQHINSTILKTLIESRSK